MALLASAVDASLLWGIRSFMQILQGESFLHLWEWFFLMILLAILRFIFMFWKVRFSENWVYRMGALVIGWFLHTLKHLSPQNFHTPNGERVVETAYESTQILQMNGSICFQAVQAGLQLIVFLPVLFYISWPLTLFLFIVVVPLIAWVQRKLHRMGPEEESLLESRSGFRQDLRLANIIYNRWSSRYERTRVSSSLMFSVRKLRERGVFSAVRKGSLSLFTETVSVLAMVIVLAFCAMLISKGWMDASGLVLFCSALLLCYKPIKECARVMPSIRAATSAYNILIKFGNLKKREIVKASSSNEYYVENGFFQYEGSDEPLFSHLSFTWNTFKPILLRGHNGVGKSTLLRLAAGLEEWQGVSSHPKDVFFVAQDLELPPKRFLHELLEKKMNKTDKISDTIREFMHKASVKSLLLKKGLSGGERARVALLWALVSNSKMILLDEPFASVALEDREVLLCAFLDAAFALEKWVIVVSHDVLDESLESRFQVVKMESLLGGGKCLR